MDEQQQIDRLRALWKSGKDKFRTFFVVLREVRLEIGDEALPDWCVDNLRIGLSAISESANLLRGIDTKIAKQELAAAAKADKEAKQAERAEKQRELEQKRAQREQQKRRRIFCPACGAQGEAGCDCDVAYISAAAYAAHAIARNPERSDRAIADEIGVDHKTVAKARTTGEYSPVEARLGRDGKRRKMPRKVTRLATEKEQHSPKTRRYIDTRTGDNISVHEAAKREATADQQAELIELRAENERLRYNLLSQCLHPDSRNSVTIDSLKFSPSEMEFRNRLDAMTEEALELGIRPLAIAQSLALQLRSFLSGGYVSHEDAGKYVYPLTGNHGFLNP